MAISTSMRRCCLIFLTHPRHRLRFHCAVLRVACCVPCCVLCVVCRGASCVVRCVPSCAVARVAFARVACSVGYYKHKNWDKPYHRDAISTAWGTAVSSPPPLLSTSLRFSMQRVTCRVLRVACCVSYCVLCVACVLLVARSVLRIACCVLRVVCCVACCMERKGYYLNTQRLIWAI